MSSLFVVDEATSPPPACMREGCTNSPPVKASPSSGPGLTWRMETYYFRRNHTYLDAPCCKPRLTKPPGAPFSRLLFYGDSTVKNSWEMLLHPARKPCKIKTWRPRHITELFQGKNCKKTKSGMAEIDPKLDKILKRCTAGAPWTSVPIGTDSLDVNKAHSYISSLFFNMSTFAYNDSFARNHQPPIPLPVPREFTMVTKHVHTIKIFITHAP